MGTMYTIGEPRYNYYLHEKGAWWNFKRFKVVRASTLVVYRTKDSMDVIADKLTKKEAEAMIKLLGE